MSVPDDYNFVCPVKTISGKRALELLPVELKALNAAKPFIIIDEAESGKKRVNTLVKAFADSNMNIGIYDVTASDATMTVIMQMADVFRNKGRDSILVAGKGALVDMAKVMNMAVCDDSFETSDAVTRGPLKPLIYIPTHCGSGFETAPQAQIEKTAYISMRLMPAIVLTDPRMIVAEPPQATFNASMTALAHAVDAYTGITKNPLKDAYAFTAIQLIKNNLVKVVQKRIRSQGRPALVNAAAMAGCTLHPAPPDGSNVARLHLEMTDVLALAASECAHIDYGVCIGLLLPFILEFHLSLNSDFGADLLLPLSDADTYAATTPHLRAPVAINKLRSFLHDLHTVTGGKIPRTLAEAGMPRFILNDIAATAAESGLKRYTVNDYMTVLKHAWDDKPFMNKGFPPK
jgi:alcohol dehydrogenase